MFVEVEFREHDTNSKALYSNNQSSDLLQDLVVEALVTGPEEMPGIRAENDTEENGERRFGEVKMVSNKLRK